LNIVRKHTATQPRSDLIILGCGTNDVWRGFQGRTEQAVSLDEYAANYDAILRLVSKHARTVACIAETPFGWDANLDATAMNAELARYNATARRLATEYGASFLDVWPDFVATARRLGAGADPGPGNPSLWSDGVHLSELGDALLLRLAERHLEANNVIAKLTT
jgi:lysophospholipase L1-like esterase